MSKLFETLYKSKGEIADMVRPLVDGQTCPPRVGGRFKSESAPKATVAETAKESSAPDRHVSRKFAR